MICPKEVCLNVNNAKRNGRWYMVGVAVGNSLYKKEVALPIMLNIIPVIIPGNLSTLYVSQV